MNTLLKDLPEHKERIENSFHLQKDITRAIQTSMSVGPELSAKRIMDLVATFVNENYEWKGIKA